MRRVFFSCNLLYPPFYTLNCSGCEGRSTNGRKKAFPHCLFPYSRKRIIIRYMTEIITLFSLFYIYLQKVAYQTTIASIIVLITRCDFFNRIPLPASGLYLLFNMTMRLSHGQKKHPNRSLMNHVFLFTRNLDA